MDDQNQVQISETMSVGTSETAATAVAVQARALVEARYILAMKHPRDLDQVRQNMMKECKRPRFADVARYHKPIGNGVEGPSIRFAEMGVRCMRNIDVSTLTVLDDTKKRIVKVSVNDIEANVPYSQDVTITKSVERRSKKQGDIVLAQRINSKGQTVYIIEATDDDILNKQNALISKAIRTLSLRLIPGDIVDECMDIISETMAAKIKADPDSEKRKIFDAFAEIGISVDSLKSYLGNDGSTITPKELTTLRAIYTAIKDGETTWQEVIDEKKPAADTKNKTQTPKQAYETLKLQLQSSGKEKFVADMINTHSGMSKHAEKDFDKNDLDYLIGEMEKELKK
ncbi:MAG: hypothetical protein JW795_03305 [Chitinivibrionales bacterium]|nr:hypothetical protein [Chitinivibrionales bacterium]